MDHNDYTGFEIAVIGMACQFPGASNVHQYWENLKNGVESVSVFSDEELREYANKEEDITNPKYVKSKGLIEDAAYFDAAFFGFSPNEANVLDPQIRILAQTAYHALEDAGYDFGESDKNIGVFVGALPSVNWQLHCFNNTGKQYSEQFSSLILNDKDFAGTRLSYLLNLHGASSTIYTACSTSLVTIDMACQSLLTGKSNMAIAGGVALSLPYKSGYIHEQGMIMSKDGHTRSFDANASGTVWSDGVGMVVLKRLEDAINDGDQIHSVIKGSGVNNDGNRKVGYTAPSIQGQVEVIEDAMSMAEVSPESINYIEGHGSATSLGDKIEISALSEVFKTVKGDYKCPIGSVKSNIGHLNTASGIAGFIKVCLMLKHSKIPPTVHFEVPNSTLTKKGCPFYVNSTLQDWKSNNSPLRAGISSFGIGGTNAHIILEEAPTAKKSKEDIRKPLVVLSAKTRNSLQDLSVSVKDFILKNPSLNIDHLAYTLQTGRQHLQYRKTVLFEDIKQLAKSLSKTSSETAIDTPKIVMMFPGMGTVYSNLGKDLYLKEYNFRKAMDQCFSILKAKTGQNYKTILYPENGSEFPKDFQTPQLLTFAFEYSLFVLLKSWRITPDYVVGYSLGEYVAACVSGIFTLESAFDILIERGRLINTLNTGGMLAVPLSLEMVAPYLTTGIDVAINNGKSIVVGGKQEHLQTFKKAIEESGIGTIEINDSYALHTSQMQPILSDFEAILEKHTLQKPTIPMISNVTGDWCHTDVTEINYWAKHLSEPIAFHKGLTTLINEHPDAIFMEVGAGNNLSLLARRTGSEYEHKLRLISLAKKAKVKTLDHDYLLKAIGMLWQYGGKVDWKVYNDGLHKSIISLPNYSFEKRTFDIIPKDVLNTANKIGNLSKRSDISSWFYVPTWQRNPLLTKSIQDETDGKTILIIGNKKEDINALLTEKEAKDTLIFAEYDTSFSRIQEAEYTLDYANKEDVIALFNALEEDKVTIDVILDVTNVGKTPLNDISDLQRLVTLFQGISKTPHAYRKLEYCIVVENVFSIYGNEQINPWNSTLLSAMKVIPQENPFIQCRFIEIDSETYTTKKKLYYQQILKEQESTVKDKIVSYKGTSRWIQNMLPYPLASKEPASSQIRHGGTYIIIGGLGDLGGIISKYLLEKFETNIILIGRSQLPEKTEWEGWIKENDTTSSLGIKVEKALRLSKLKGTVEFMQADSTNYEDLRKVFEKVQVKYNQIDGLFHSAGAIAQNSFNVVNSINEEQLGFHFPVKTKGLDVIQKVVEKYPVTFVAIMSSLSSILGGLGMVGYAGANQFMDSTVELQNNINSSTKWMAFNFSNWEGWDTDFEELSLSDIALETFITANEGENVFNGLFSKSNTHSQIIISPVNLLALKDKWENTQIVGIEDNQYLDNGSNIKPELSNDYKEPSTDLEKELVHIWEEIFGFEPIGIFDDFMELGGDSLKAITMLSHVHGKTTMTMSIKDFFNNTTIEKLSRTIKAKDFKRIPKAPIRDFYPVTASQSRMWVLSQLEGGNMAYNLFRFIRFKGTLDHDKFQESFNLLIARHESLRTHFETNEEGEIFQYIKGVNEIDFEIAQYDFTSKDKDEIRQYLTDEQTVTFNLAEPPLYRAKLIKTGKEEYIFSFVIHHIISDGWAMELLISEVVKNYNSLYKGENIQHKELSIQYKDYSVWLSAQKSTDNYKETEAYWLSKFQGAIPVLDLPSFRKRPRVWNYRGNTISHQFPESFIIKLKDFSKSYDATMFMTLMTSINILLHRYTNQDDIIIGTPVAGREHSDIQNQIGLYLNTIAIRTEINEVHSFVDLLKKTKQSLLEGFDHQNYPLDDLIAKLNIKRDTSRSALFDVLVVLQSQSQIKAIQSDIKIQDIEATPYEVEITTAKFDLTFFFVETDTLELSIQYNRDIYDEFLISKIFKHLEHLIDNVIIKPEEPLHSFSFLTDDEQKTLSLNTLNFENSTQNETIVSLFEKQVEEKPNTIALTHEDCSLSFLELNEYANKLAYYLDENYQIQANDLVGIEIERNEWMLISILAILKSGGAYVPIDKNYPKERISFIKKQSKCKTVITEPLIQTFLTKINTLPSKNIHKEIDTSHLAYVIYTSGSTGNPKGVMISHSNISDYVHGLFKNTKIGLCKSFALMSNIATDLGNTVLFGSLLSGGTLYLPKNETLRNANEIHEYFKKHTIDCIKIVPTHWRALSLENTMLIPEKMIIFGGELLPVEYVESIQNQRPKSIIVNHYGPTETTIGKLLFEVDANVKYDNIPIGKPFSDTIASVVDKYFNLCPMGVTGELLIGGAGLSNGYLNNTQLTDEKFIENPFLKDEGKLYMTGDLVRILPSGHIEFIGRKDDQVKIRGYRIELKEIEKAFLNVYDIEQCVVIVKKEQDEKFIVAYYTGASTVDKNDLRSLLMKVLPEYMIPKYYVQMDSIPFTNNGKIDKTALPIVGEEDLIKNIYIVPRTNEEKVLTKIWSNVLNSDKIGIKDNFYHLGGDSIKAILVISRLKQQGYELKAEQLLKNPILEDLAKLVKTEVKLVDQSEISGTVELTPIQVNFFERSDVPNKNHYNQSVLLKSNSQLNSSVLNKSITHLVKHHDALRMRFKNDTDGWSQHNQIDASSNYKISYYDLSNEPDSILAMQSIGEQLQSSIDIKSSALFQIGHFKVKEADYLALIIHHLVVDGVSWRILIEDFIQLYEGYKLNQTTVLPLKTDAYQYWALVQKQYAQSQKLLSEIGYWENICSTVVSKLTTEKKETHSLHTLDAKYEFELDEKTTKILKTEAHKKYNTEVNDLLLTTLSFALKDIFSLEKSIISMEGHGREEIIDGIDLSRTIGWFTSKFPFLLDISNAKGYELIKVKEDLRNVPSKGIGYGILHYLYKRINIKSQPKIQFNYLGDFTTLFQDDNNSTLSYTGEKIGFDTDSNNQQSPFFLDLIGSIISGKLCMTINYSTACYNKQTIQKFGDSYRKHLENLVLNLSTDINQVLTPSDLTYPNLTYKELLEINSKNNIEDLYQLSPLQQGLYYHWLKDRSNSMYFEQFSYRFKIEDLNPVIIEKSFRKLISRHTILRTAFNSDVTDIPLQIVYNNFSVDFSYQEMPDTEKDSAAFVESCKVEDRLRGFDLEKPNLVRLKVLKLTEGEFTFIWSFHHILMDGWCISILVNEFYEIWLGENKELSLPEPIPYSNYIKWLTDINNTETLDYWKNYLSGLDTITAIPFMKRKELQIENKPVFKTKRLRFDGENFSKAKTLIKDLDITFNTLIQGVWGYLLSRYNNSNDIAFGSVVSGRPADLVGVEAMVGLFINTIPIRISCQDNDTVEIFLKRLHNETIESLPYHYTGLSEVQSQSKLGMNLITSLVIFENFLTQDDIKDEVDELSASARGKSMMDEVNIFEQTNYDFNITVFPEDDELGFEFQYNTNIFKEEIIENITVHFYDLLIKMSIGKTEKINSIDFLSQNETLKLLDTFNNTFVPHQKETHIINLFESQVKENPHSIAIAFQGLELTYFELNQKSNQLVNFLNKTTTIESEDLIGIQITRNEWLIISIIAVLKTGAAYVPIDPDYPEQRIRYIREDSNCKIIIDEDLINTFKNESESYASDNLNTVIKETSLAYVIYTSGSTGKPKGVMVEHRNMLHQIRWYVSAFSISKNTKSLLLTSYTFDPSIQDIFGTLIKGGILHIIPKKDIENLDLVWKYLNNNQITQLNYVPQYVYALLADKPKIDSLEILIVGGEALMENVKKAIINKGYTLYNNYGPTEITVDAISGVMDESPVNIGKPIDNTQALILNDNDQLAPIEIPGTLYISGDGVTRGYLNQPELTQDKFVTHPFDSSKRIYNTGDMARWLSNGKIEFLGREDRQVKIRGHRVELSEIEYQLINIKTIRNAVVHFFKDDNENMYLCAYLIGDNVINREEVKEKLDQKLPKYMIPSFFTQLYEIPLTPNQKTDYKALPLPSVDLKDKIIRHPSNAEEVTITQLFSEVLNVEIQHLSIDDDFFELGGHSIKAMQLLSRIHKQTGVKLDLASIFNTSKISELAKLVSETNPLAEYEILTVTDKPYYKTSSIQRRLYYLQNLELTSIAYNMPIAYEMKGVIDKDKIELAFRALVERHDSLRTYFEVVDNEIVQKIDNGKLINIAFLEGRKDKTNNIIQDFVKPFNLNSAPLFRAKWVILEQDQHLLLFDFHHIITDAFSINTLVHDFIMLYQEKALEELPFQYKDYSEWLYSDAALNIQQKQKEYWKSKLYGNTSYVRLPSNGDGKRNSNEYTVTINSLKTQKLKQFAMQQTVTLNILLQSIFNINLGKVAYQDSITMGMPMSGRRTSDLEYITGMFVNTVVLINYPNKDKLFLDFLNEVKNTALEAFENQEYPFEELVTMLGTDIKSGQNPIFNVMFEFQNIDLSEIEIPNLAISLVSIEKKASKFDLTLIIEEIAGELVLKYRYSQLLFTNESINGFDKNFQQLIDQVLEYKNPKISDLVITGDLESDLLQQLSMPIED